MRCYILRRNSPWPARIGNRVIGRPFTAWTFLIWIHFPTERVEISAFLHEKRHVIQFYWCWLIGFVVWFVLSRSWWWIAATPFTFTALYGLASFVAWIQGADPYHDNAFEQAARDAAGEK